MICLFFSNISQCICTILQYMNKTISLLILTILVPLIPFTYLEIRGIAHQELYSYCLNDQQASNQYKLCVSCFYPSKNGVTEIKQDDPSKFLKYHKIQIGSTHYSDPQEPASQTEKQKHPQNLHRNFKIIPRRSPFRVFSLPLYTDNVQFQCNQILQLLDYSSFRMEESLDTIEFQNEGVPSIQQLRHQLSIDFLGPQSKNGKYQFFGNSTKDVNVGMVFKEPKDAENFNMIFVKYLGKQGVYVWHICLLVVFLGCLGVLFCYELLVKKKQLEIILIINVMVLICIGGPQMIKFLNILWNDLNLGLEIFLDRSIQKFGFSLFICLCFKKINTSKWILASLLILLSCNFNSLIYYVLIFITVIIFIAYSSMYLEFQNYSIYLGSCLTILIVTNLYIQAFHDQKAEVFSHTIVMIAATLVELVGQTPVEHFQEYRPVSTQSKGLQIDHDDEERGLRN